MPKDALAGIRVVDFTWAGAGALATALLAYLGAEVIKVESMRRLDGTRLRMAQQGAAPKSVNASTRFNDVNLNKLSVTLNLQEPKAVEIVERIVKVSDIAAENFRAGVMNRLGLGYGVLRELRPDLVMLSSSASGQSGPEAGYRGYASIFSAMAGLGHVTGYVDGPPVEMRLPMDFVSAATAAFVVLAALNHRQRTGQGQHLDLSSREVLSCFIGDILVDAAANGRDRGRQGNRDEIMAPHNCYPCKGEDQWISIAIGSDGEWESFCCALGNPRWTKQERFSDQMSRWKNQEELDRLVAVWTKDYTPYEVMHRLQRAGVAAVPSMSNLDIFEDPHLKARKLSTMVVHPEIGKQPVVGPPYKMSTTQPRIKRHAPLLGEHNGYVFGEVLGLSMKDIEDLVEEEVAV